MEVLSFKACDDSDAVVTAYLHSPIYEMQDRGTMREKYPVLVLCPGGAYRFTSEREADCVAFEYLSAGYNVFTLNYSCGEKAKDFRPLKELSSTVMSIRKNADKWHCMPNKIAVMGFSAGGHLAASLATMWDNEEFKKAFDTESGLNRPNAAILCYPVITADEYAHVESIENVSGCKEGTEGYKFFSLDKQVSSKTCPIFIWHTGEDSVVPCENTIKLISALQHEKIPFECHIFPHGDHGSSVCTEETASFNEHNSQWMELSRRWLAQTFDYRH